MRSLVAPAAIFGSLLCSLVSLAHAADRSGEPPFGGPPPQRQIEERPFGGPPPRSRSIQPDGVICRTATGLCRLEKGRPVGAACSCPAGGKETVPGKVE
jgi:hypothetical protein